MTLILFTRLPAAIQLKMSLVFSVMSVRYWNFCARLTKLANIDSHTDWLETCYRNVAKDLSAIRESLQYGTLMSNICSISQPMSVNL